MTIKSIILNIFNLTNTDVLLLNRHPRVLFYHGVENDIKDYNIESESIGTNNFERQLKYVIKHFKPISLNEFYQKYIANSWDGREILLTFDDGYRNLLTDGLPLLEKYNIPFALFVTTENIDKYLLFPTTINRLVNIAKNRNTLEANRISKLLKTETLESVERICCNLLNDINEVEMKSLRNEYSSVNPMNWDEVRKIAQSPLCTIGSHCLTHICCHDKQDINEVRRQLSDSKIIIEAQLGKPCEYLAWPNGNYTSEFEKVAEECGYKMAFSTKYRPINASGPFSVGRIQVPYDYARFKYVISRFPR